MKLKSNVIKKTVKENLPEEEVSSFEEALKKGWSSKS